MSLAGSQRTASKGRRPHPPSQLRSSDSCSIPPQCVSQAHISNHHRRMAWLGRDHHHGSLLDSACTLCLRVVQRSPHHTLRTVSQHQSPCRQCHVHTERKLTPLPQRSAPPSTAHTACSGRRHRLPTLQHTTCTTSTETRRTARSRTLCTTMPRSQHQTIQLRSRCSHSQPHCLSSTRTVPPHSRCSLMPRRSLRRPRTAPHRS